MRRRLVLAFGSGAAAAMVRCPAIAQPKVLRVGAVSGQPRSATGYVAFERRMAELGYREGKDFIFEYVYAPTFEAFAPGYRELVARGVDIFLATGPEIALKSALATAGGRPIVMVAIDYDPIARSYITNLAHPNNNVTGVFFQQIELSAKRLQLFHEAFPELRYATVLWDRISVDQWHAIQDAGRSLGLEFAGIELGALPYDYDQALARAPAPYRGGLIVATSPFLFRDRAKIAQVALRNRALSMFVFREWVDVGGLMSYGPSLTSMYRRAAEISDRIAHGAAPSDLPIEQPTTFELVINLTTARAIGAVIPPSLLVRADHVVQ
jgi:putative ABC transport system substrate-binding protein